MFKIPYYKKILKELEHYPLVSIIHHKQNKGAPAARNTAIRAAQYDLIFPIDSDDRLAKPDLAHPEKNFIDQAHELFQKHPETDVVFSDIRIFGARQTIHTCPNFDESTFLERCTIWINGMHKKSTSIDMGGYDESLDSVEDFGYWAKMIEHKNKQKQTLVALRIAEPFYEYRRTMGQNSTSSKSTHIRGWQQIIARFPDLYKKHFPQIDLNDLPAWFHRREQLRTQDKPQCSIINEFSASTQSTYKKPAFSCEFV